MRWWAPRPLPPGAVPTSWQSHRVIEALEECGRGVRGESRQHRELGWDAAHELVVVERPARRPTSSGMSASSTEGSCSDTKPTPPTLQSKLAKTRAPGKPTRTPPLKIQLLHSTYISVMPDIVLRWGGIVPVKVLMWRALRGAAAHRKAGRPPAPPAAALIAIASIRPRGISAKKYIGPQRKAGASATAAFHLHQRQARHRAELGWNCARQRVVVQGPARGGSTSVDVSAPGPACSCCHIFKHSHQRRLHSTTAGSSSSPTLP